MQWSTQFGYLYLIRYFFQNPVGSGSELQNPVGSRSGKWILFKTDTWHGMRCMYFHPNCWRRVARYWGLGGKYILGGKIFVFIVCLKSFFWRQNLGRHKTSGAGSGENRDNFSPIPKSSTNNNQVNQAFDCRINQRNTSVEINKTA